MKIDSLLTAALLAAATAGCQSETPSSGKLIASVNSARHVRAQTLAMLSLDQQEALLGPPAASAKRVRALVAPTDLTMGPVDAPVVLIAYVDFGVADGDAVRALIDVQRAHPHDLRIALKPLASTDPRSRDAAQAIVAATAQGKGWEVARCASRPGGTDPVLGINACTATVELDLTRFASDLSAAGPTLAANAASAAHLVVTQSPTLFLNGYRIKGVPPGDALAQGVTNTIAHAWAFATKVKLERAQIYPELMRTASIPPQPVDDEEIN